MMRPLGAVQMQLPVAAVELNFPAVGRDQIVVVVTQRDGLVQVGVAAVGERLLVVGLGPGCGAVAVRAAAAAVQHLHHRSQPVGQRAVRAPDRHDTPRAHRQDRGDFGV